MIQTCIASDRAISIIRGSTALSKASTVPDPAEMQHSPQHEGSARPATGSASGQEQEGSAGSRRFTPAQQAVATALMVVVKRAMRDGKDALSAAKLTLGSNNQATRPFLQLLADNAPLSTMQEIEQRATDQLVDSLTKCGQAVRSCRLSAAGGLHPQHAVHCALNTSKQV